MYKFQNIPLYHREYRVYQRQQNLDRFFLGQQVLPSMVLVAVDHDLAQRMRPADLKWENDMNMISTIQ